MSSINLRTLGVPSNLSFLGSGTEVLSRWLGNDRFAPPASSTPPSGGAPFSTIYAFGDSLSDAGNVYAATLHTVPAAPYVNGHFSNGPTWVEDLATQLGLPVLRPNLRGGTDFAYGGAKTGPEVLHSQNPTDLPSQFVQFAITHPVPQPNALYTVSIGSNDVFDAISAFPTSPEVAAADITQAVANEMSFIAALADDGARNVLVLNVPDLGDTPAAIAKGPQGVQIASALSASYDAQLDTSLSALAAQDQLNLHVVDTYSLLNQGIADPAAYGFTNVSQPVWTGNLQGSGTLNAAGSAQNGYLFFDTIHPTAAGHKLLATAALADLRSPV